MRSRLTVFLMAFIFSTLVISVFTTLRRNQSGEERWFTRIVQSAGFHGHIVAWKSADHFTVQTEDQTVVILLKAVATPDPDAPGGQQALEHVRTLSAGLPVRILEMHQAEDGTIVAEVYNHEEISLNESLMQSGWGKWVVEESPNNPYYRDLEASAREEKRGLWSLGEPVFPTPAKRY